MRGVKAPRQAGFGVRRKGDPCGRAESRMAGAISRIRAAIEDDPKSPRRVLTVRGAGYVFARKQDGDDAK